MNPTNRATRSRNRGLSSVGCPLVVSSGRGQPAKDSPQPCPIRKNGTRSLTILAWLALGMEPVFAAGGLPTAPSWERSPAERSTASKGVLPADRSPMPLLYEFTWSAAHDANFFHYFSQFLGSSHSLWLSRQGTTRARP